MEKINLSQQILQNNLSKNLKASLLTLSFHMLIAFLLLKIFVGKSIIMNFDSKEISKFNVFYENNQKESQKKQDEKKLVKNDLNAISNDLQENKIDNQDRDFAKDISSPIYDAEFLNNRQPKYPALSIRRGEEGQVLLRVMVDENGFAKNVEIAKSSSYNLLDSTAVQTIKNWRFIPAKKFGQNIMSSVLIPINFKLNNSNA